MNNVVDISVLMEEANRIADVCVLLHNILSSHSNLIEQQRGYTNLFMQFQQRGYRMLFIEFQQRGCRNLFIEFQQ